MVRSAAAAASVLAACRAVCWRGTGRAIPRGAGAFLSAPRGAHALRGAAAAAASVPARRTGGTSKMGKGSEKDGLENLSRTISTILRHTAKVRHGLDVRPDGYVLLEDLLQVPLVKKLGPTERDIEKVVEENDKQRFSLWHEKNYRTWIRANQGHSLKGIVMEQLCEPVEELRPGEVWCHGTFEKHMESILSKGLLAGGNIGQRGRNDVHFSTRNPGEDVLSGMRYDAQIAVYIDLPRAVRSGIRFFRSANGVILSKGLCGAVPPEFIESIWHIKKMKKLYPAGPGDSGNVTDATIANGVMPTSPRRRQM